jgi:hypothetical protein
MEYLIRISYDQIKDLMNTLVTRFDLDNGDEDLPNKLLAVTRGVFAFLQVPENEDQRRFELASRCLQGLLSNYKMMNDYVEVYPAKIINLAWEIDILSDNSFNKNNVITNVINTVKNYMDINNREMGENLYLGQLKRNICDVAGVIHVIDLRCYNKVNGNYSANYINQTISDKSTMQISLTDDIIYSEPDGCFETKYPVTDIRVRVKNN